MANVLIDSQLDHGGEDNVKNGEGRIVFFLMFDFYLILLYTLEFKWGSSHKKQITWLLVLKPKLPTITILFYPNIFPEKQVEVWYGLFLW